jgi:L-ascorbate metabolism protein UlaG (beta-lactamase superfamily)
MSEEEISFFDVIRWKLFESAAAWPKYVENEAIPQLPKQVADGELFVTLINHATELIQLANLTILTDPIFSKRASPISWLGPKRVRAPALGIEQLPKIDVILISHNHYDHLDIPSLQAIERKNHPLYLIPLGNRNILEKCGIKNIVELDWWDEYQVNEKRRIVMAPAKHWSGRGLFDRREALWGSYIILSSDLTVFFAGDTGYGAHFKEIRSRYGKIDVSLLPIGAYEPRWFMKENHMDPQEAVQAYLDLESTVGLGMHYDTFHLANESIDAPVKMLHAHIEKLQLADPKMFKPQLSGETTYHVRYE